MAIEVSVVVPTFRRRALLGRCLAALAGQTLDPASYEVIVADDAADEATERQLARWARTGRTFRYVAVRGERHGPSAARNAGWRLARGWLVAFTDDDTVPAADWIERGLDGFRAETMHAAWGLVRVPLPPRPTDYQRDAAGLERAGFVTANCFVRQAALERVGGFDERFTLAWREDSDLFFRLLDLEYDVTHLPQAVVVHPVRSGRWGVSLAQQRKAAFDALLYREHPSRYREHVRPGRPLLYYPIVLALLALVVAALLGDRTLAAAAGGAWVGLTGWFAARRLRGTSRAPAHVAEMLVTSALVPPLSLFWRVRGGLRYRVPFW